MFSAVSEEAMLGDEIWIEVEVVDPLFDQMGIEVDKSLVISEERIPKENCIFLTRFNHKEVASKKRKHILVGCLSTCGHSRRVFHLYCRHPAWIFPSLFTRDGG